MTPLLEKTMRNAPNLKANRHRIRTGELASVDGCGNNGAFLVPALSAGRPIRLSVIVSDGLGWDHVSVSLPDRCPTWEEMCFVKNLFFREDERVVQYHPAKAEYRNEHAFCLHLWRCQTQEFPAPPPELVSLERPTKELVDEYLEKHG